MGGSANPAMAQATGGGAFGVNQGSMGSQFSGMGASAPSQDRFQSAQPSAPNYSSMNPYQQAASAQSGALGRTTELMSYQPERVSATGYEATTQQGPATAASQMGTYANPYESQVVQQTLRDIGSQAQMGQQQLAGQAQAAKAFGGSRHGIAEAEAMKGYTQQMTDAAARMRQQGFNTALGAAQFDVGQQQATAAANQAAMNQAAQFGAQQGMTAQQLNQAAGLQGANLNLSAANQLGNLGQQSFGYGQAIQQQQLAQGAMQRGMMQQLIDAGQAGFNRYTQTPYQGLNTLTGALTGAGVPAGESQSYQPGFLNYLQFASGLR